MKLIAPERIDWDAYWNDRSFSMRDITQAQRIISEQKEIPMQDFVTRIDCVDCVYNIENGESDECADCIQTVKINFERKQK